MKGTMSPKKVARLLGPRPPMPPKREGPVYLPRRPRV